MVSCRKISNDITARKREKRQFFGNFASLSVGPYFNLAWGGGQSGWYGYGPYNYGYGPYDYGYGWGMPWQSFGPRFMRRRFLRRRWGFNGGFGGPWFFG
ncbi:unnamed protein product [Cercopithifilaria johnstoni]|uniref:Uncharacterized protein n=1 Tax=Cercopithifilaria johnstoni TaxID=2874296 RepID=A0A8J2LUQ9_9BILA|nr:unnamed protein product [Cercopithifilaria johnstoni]